MSKTRKIIIVIASIALVVCAFMLIKTTLEYKRAEDEYTSLEQYAVLGDGDFSDEEAPPEEEIPEEAGEEEKTLTRNYNRSDFPDLTVDFDSLKKINSSFVCWLYAPGAEINHPVVQGTDNEFYLHHTFEMQKNSSGCIFMDHEVDPMLTSRNTFFYGHNMKNGTMFGHLKNYINNKAVYDKDHTYMCSGLRGFTAMRYSHIISTIRIPRCITRARRSRNTVRICARRPSCLCVSAQPRLIPTRT